MSPAENEFPEIRVTAWSISLTLTYTAVSYKWDVRLFLLIELFGKIYASIRHTLSYGLVNFLTFICVLIYNDQIN